MAMYKGSTRLAALFWGSTAISRVYHGSTLVFEKAAGQIPAPDITSTPLYWFSADNAVYKDDAKTQLAADGDIIRYWGNRGSRADASQATAGNRPVYRTGGKNGQPYIQCNGLNQFFANLDYTAPSGITSTIPFTVFLVFDQVDRTAGSPILAGTGGASEDGYGKTGIRLTTGGTTAWYKSTCSHQYPEPPHGFNIQVLSKGNGDALYHRYQHYDQTARTQITASGNYSIAATSTQFLRSTASNLFFKGRLHEIIIFGAEISQAEQNTVLSYLRSKYAH